MAKYKVSVFLRNEKVLTVVRSACSGTSNRLLRYNKDGWLCVSDDDNNKIIKVNPKDISAIQVEKLDKDEEEE